jgi:hypothetical protein
VGEREAEDDGEEGVREKEQVSCKEIWFVSGGAPSAEPEAAEAANWASTTISCRQPGNGDGNVGCIALGTEGKCCAVSSPFAGP